MSVVMVEDACWLALTSWVRALGFIKNGLSVNWPVQLVFVAAKTRLN